MPFYSYSEVKTLQALYGPADIARLSGVTYDAVIQHQRRNVLPKATRPVGKSMCWEADDAARIIKWYADRKKGDGSKE